MHFLIDAQLPPALAKNMCVVSQSGLWVVDPDEPPEPERCSRIMIFRARGGNQAHYVFESPNCSGNP
jgi:hypothetical protein